MPYNYFLEWYPECALQSGIEEPKEFSEVDVFPNPVVDILNVKNNFNNQVEYSLFNSIGVLISNGAISQQSQVKLDTNGFPSGVYYLRLEDGIKQKSQKFLKL